MTALAETLLKAAGRPETFGRSLRSLRTERGLTQAALARAAKVNQGQISEYESGKCLPEAGPLSRIHDALSRADRRKSDEKYF